MRQRRTGNVISQWKVVHLPLIVFQQSEEKKKRIYPKKNQIKKKKEKKFPAALNRF